MLPAPMHRSFRRHPFACALLFASVAACGSAPTQRAQPGSVKNPEAVKPAPGAASNTAVPATAVISPEAIAQGAALYKQMCAVCHGANGEGYKADQAPAIMNPEFLASVSVDFLRHAIAIGRRGTTMSAWA